MPSEPIDFIKIGAPAVYDCAKPPQGEYMHSFGGIDGLRILDLYR